MRWLTLLLLVLVQCSSDPAVESTTERVCDPGKQDACPCPGGTEGAQSCNADGSGFNECQCETGGVGGSAGSGGPNGGSGGSGGGLSGASGTAGNSATAGTGGTGGISGSAGEAGMAGASGTAGVAGSGGIAGTGGSANQCGDGPIEPLGVTNSECAPLNGPSDLNANNSADICDTSCGFPQYAFSCGEGIAPMEGCKMRSLTSFVSCCPKTMCREQQGANDCDPTLPNLIYCYNYGATPENQACVQYPNNPAFFCCP